MAHVITSLLAVSALLLQGVFVGGHVHPTHAGASAAAARIAVAATDGAPSSTANDEAPAPITPDDSGCAFCQLAHASGVFVAAAAPLSAEPILHAARAAPPTSAAPRRERRADIPLSRGPPAFSSLYA